LYKPHPLTPSTARPLDAFRRAESKATTCVAPRAGGDEQSAQADFVSS
jgi:hypothetical protein